jgi:hypothetical protein
MQLMQQLKTAFRVKNQSVMSIKAHTRSPCSARCCAQQVSFFFTFN